MTRSRGLYSVLLHVCIWSALVFFVLLLIPRHPMPREAPLNSLQLGLTILPFIGIFYLHAYWLIPNYLFRKKRVTYVLYVLIAIAAAALLSTLSLYMGSPSPKPYHLAALRRVFPAVFFVVASASLAAFRQNFR